MRTEITDIVAWSRCDVCNDCGAAISTNDPADTADSILALLKERVETLENPFEQEMKAGHGGRYNGFESYRHAFLEVLS